MTSACRPISENVSLRSGRSLWQRGSGTHPGVAAPTPLVQSLSRSVHAARRQLRTASSLVLRPIPPLALPRAVRDAPASIARFLLPQVPIARRASPPREQSQHPLLRQAIRTAGSSICCLDNSAGLEQNEDDVVLSCFSSDPQRGAASVAPCGVHIGSADDQASHNLEEALRCCCV